MGAEYNKWSRRVTATHNVSLAFTRMLLGPMDYTPGGFRNATPATFEVVNSPPQVQTTRGQGLGMFVVYESPFQMVADSPDVYAERGGLRLHQDRADDLGRDALPRGRHRRLRGGRAPQGQGLVHRRDGQ